MPVTVVELGPARTGGDTTVHVPDADAVFTADPLFSQGTPIVWADYGGAASAAEDPVQATPPFAATKLRVARPPVWRLRLDIAASYQ